MCALRAHRRQTGSPGRELCAGHPTPSRCVASRVHSAVAGLEARLPRAKQGYRIYERIDMLNNGIDQSRAQPHRSVSTQCRTRLTRRCRRRSWRQWWRRLGTAACEVHPVGHRTAVAREMRTTRMRTARRVGQQRSHRQEEKHAAAPVTDVRSKRKKAKTR